MISLIFYRCLFIFMSPVLALELSRGSNAPEVNFSDEQWQLLKDAFFSDRTGFMSPEWENKLDSIFPEITIPELPSQTLDTQAIASCAPKKASDNTYRICPLCGKLVSKISVHLRYHKDEYNYPCDECPCMFKEACNLSKHKKRHQAKRAFENKNVCGLSAMLVGNLNKTGSGATQQKPTLRKTADEKDQEDPEAYRNSELQALEYIPTESAKPVLGKLSLLSKVVSDASDPRLARSLERMAQNSEQAAVFPNHLRLEFKVKKYTPTSSSTSPNNLLKPQPAIEPNLDFSNLKKFTCPNCSATYKRQAYLEKHLAICVAQTKSPLAIKLPAVPRIAFDQSPAQRTPAGARHLGDVLEADTQAVKKFKKNDQKFVCTLCEKKYGRIGHLNKHLLSHNRGPKKPVVAHLEGIVCAVCSKTFKYDRDFEDHMNAHTGQKPHVCPNCDKGFAARSNLTDHMRHYCSEQK